MPGRCRTAISHPTTHTAQAVQPTCDGVVAVRVVEAEAISVVVVNHLVCARHVSRRDEHGVTLTIVVACGVEQGPAGGVAGRRQSQQGEGPRNTV